MPLDDHDPATDDDDEPDETGHVVVASSFIRLDAVSTRFDAHKPRAARSRSAGHVSRFTSGSLPARNGLETPLTASEEACCLLFLYLETEGAKPFTL